MPRSLPLDLYVITSAGLALGRGHREVALAAVDGGATAIQLRAPELSDEDLLPLATDLAARCRAAGMLFVVNDRIEVARRSESGGVHLGQGDLSPGIREAAGDLALGVSVGTVDEARAAASLGADYLGVTVWPTPTKPEAAAVSLDGLRAIARATDVPVVGVGGIDATNAAQVLDAGAAGVAVVSAVGAAPDPVAATRELAELVRGAARRRA